MNTFLPIIYAALLVEAVVNTIANVKDKERSWKYWLSFIGSIIVAVLVAVNYDIDFFKALGFEGQLPFVGAVLSGIIISRGANIVADLAGSLNASKKRNQSANTLNYLINDSSPSDTVTIPGGANVVNEE